jgi:hypothetical protein
MVKPYQFLSPEETRPAGSVDVSAGTEMPDGILGKPLVANGPPTAARAVMGNASYHDVRSEAGELGDEKAQRLRSALDRKR